MPKRQDTIPCYVGVDPGMRGGIAIIHGDAVGLFKIEGMTNRDLYDTIGRIPEHGLVALEKVGGYVGSDKARGSHMFNFGRIYGFLQACLVNHSVEEVPPQKWLKHFGMKRTKGESDTKWKNRLKGKAQQLFPKVKVTLALADALLIARYCQLTGVQ